MNEKKAIRFERSAYFNAGNRHVQELDACNFHAAFGIYDVFGSGGLNRAKNEKADALMHSHMGHKRFAEKRARATAEMTATLISAA
jgi:hypothetical protein